MAVSEVGTLILGASGLITGLIALFSANVSKRKTNTEADVNDATAANSREQLFQSRELFWRKEMQTMHETFQSEINELRTEVAWLRVLIENHVPWDWEVVRQLKLAGIDFREPPTLHYIKKNVS
jgi:hypothetical protein